MRVLVPATKAPAWGGGEIHEIVGADGYWAFFAALWADPQDVIIVEHDIVPSTRALLDLMQCPQSWCTQPYPYFVGMYHGLGCVKFSADLMRATPHLWDQVAAMSDPTHPPKHWCRLDAWSTMMLARAGFAKHAHNIEVGHQHSGAPSHGCA